MSGHSESYSIIVPVFNALYYLQRTTPVLHSLVEGNPAAELIFVDNGSNDGSWAYLKDFASRKITVLRVPDVRVGEVRNTGARVARGSTLVFVDSDCLVPDDYLLAIESAFANSGAAAVGAYYSMSPEPNWLERAWHTLHAPVSDGFTTWVPAGNLAVRKPVFVALGGFRGDLSSGEDVEFCTRLQSQGTPVYQSRGIVSHHLGNARKVGNFVRQQAWHGEGMLAMGSRRRFSRPLLMTLIHWSVVGLAVMSVILTKQPLASGMLIITLSAMLIPVTTVTYRGIQNQRIVNPVTGSVAYFLYYLARGISLLRIASSWWH